MEDGKKICPLLAIAPTHEEKQTIWCEKENCEFWCKWTECCALTAIASHLADLRR